VLLFCPSVSFLAEAQPRLENRRRQKAILAEVHIKFFRRPPELQSKRHHWKSYKFILYLLFSNRLWDNCCLQLQKTSVKFPEMDNFFQG
jgi:hypothetical protein